MLLFFSYVEIFQSQEVNGNNRKKGEEEKREK